MEAMAAGKPILGYRTGAIVDLVKHGVNGYLAESIDDLYDGLVYCIENTETLGENSRELAKEFSWQRAVEKLAEVYRRAAQKQRPTVSVIIPCYNYASLVERAIQSAIIQDYPDLEHIVVVDDGSTDNTKEVVEKFNDPRVKYIHQENSGVANARNNGIASVDSTYICCLDADDFILRGFLSSCVRALEGDRTLGAAYTKLRLISRDGTREAKRASEWPTRFNYDLQVIGQNQIPTCCVYRREAWERLGGYRQRYAPKGCGSEDAEFWLRMGSIGYGAKLATEDPLFIYSFGGRTTGDANYEEIDWLYWHPWARDALHPFASVATPERDSHPVLSYDNPLISVIIPVGPGHEKSAINALDSLTAQSLRQWEGICVWDSTDTEVLEEYKRAFPFIRWVQTDGGEGAGYSRNRGVEVARAPLLMFLDADDWFYPTMLERCIDEYSAQGGDVAIYTDSVGKALLDQETVDKAEDGKILYYDPATKETVIAQKNKTYNWEKAILQPNNADMYIWNYISTLHPKSWFYEIGGFDEVMESWEDWDYWIRLAHKGKCFIHLEEELMVYPYYTGNRRQQGIDNWEKLVAYMKAKYEGVEMMPCRGCGNKRRSPPPRIPIRQTTNVFQTAQREAGQVSFDFDSDMVMISYNSPNRGDHRVVGHAQFQYAVQGLRMIETSGALRVDYGYRKQGDRFLVHRREIEAAPHLFQPVSAAIPEIQIASQARRPQTRAPNRLVSNPLTGEELTGDRKFDLQTIPGISADVATQLRDKGIDMPEDIIELGVDGLKEIRGVGNRKAEVIIAAVQKRLEEIG
jgi:glycosyltransferase involved in cell wall biosynthesis